MDEDDETQILVLNIMNNALMYNVDWWMKVDAQRSI